MFEINRNYSDLQGSYLFSEIAKRVATFKAQHPDADIIKMGIGDVTRPLVPNVIEALHKAVDEMGHAQTFRGYGPEQGYDFLIDKIIEYDYKRRGVTIERDEVFVSDGSKCDVGNIQEIFSADSIVAVTDPVYPVYVDSNVMAGRAGTYNKALGQYERIVYLPCTVENGFAPELPKARVDIIYLCYPNNPTGMTLTKEQLKVWVDYALEHGAVILFDSAYESYITDLDVPHSIYEIDGAKSVAIEFRSMSKTAGFTGTRCAYTVVPKQLVCGDIKLNSLWNRRHTTKFNGVSYITQRGAEAIYTGEGREQINNTVAYYMENARIIRESIKAAGMQAFGGVNAPYIWLKTPQTSSWDFFDRLLSELNIIGTPGVGFGRSGGRVLSPDRILLARRYAAGYGPHKTALLISGGILALKKRVLAVLTLLLAMLMLTESAVAAGAVSMAPPSGSQLGPEPVPVIDYIEGLADTDDTRYPLAARSVAVKAGSDWKYDEEQKLNTDSKKFYIVVDVVNQVTTIYEKGKSGNYDVPVRQMICTTGARSTPTPLGTFSMAKTRKRFGYFTEFKCYAQYWTQVGGGIYFHSTLYSRRHEIYKTKTSISNLGKAVSHGCIRLTPNDAHWLYLYIPAKTKILITDDIPRNKELTKQLKAIVKI